MMTNGFLLVGPGIMSYFPTDTYYDIAHALCEDVQATLGLPLHKLGDWSIIWL